MGYNTALLDRANTQCVEIGYNTALLDRANTTVFETIQRKNDSHMVYTYLFLILVLTSGASYRGLVPTSSNKSAS